MHDAVGEAVHDAGGDLPADVADERGDREPGHRVVPGLAEGHRGQPGQRPGRGQRIEPECRASAIKVAEPMRRPMTSLYRTTAGCR